MNLKKLLIIALTFVHSFFVFSQSEDYKMHFEKAKQYENNKQLIYALGEYYDAYVLDVNQTEARERFENLLDTISEGNPGYGDYDVFDLYDNWILLLQEYERYWTEYCPFIITISKLEKKNLNIENKTVTYNYNFHYSLEDNEKFSRITKAVKLGLYRVYTTQKWNKDYLYSLSNERNGNPYWHTTTVYNEQNEENTYYKNDTAIFRYHNYGVRLLASTTSLPYLEEWYEGARTWNTSTNLFTTLYDISLKIIDKDGNLITEIDRQLVNSFVREVTLTAKDMKKIDSGEYRIVPKDLYLFYGDPETNPGITFKGLGEREFLNKLTDIKVDLSKATILDSYAQEEYEKKKAEDRKIREEKQFEMAAIESEVKYALNDIDYTLRHNIYRDKIIEIKKSSRTKNNKNRHIFFRLFNFNITMKNMEVLSNKYGSEKVENVLYYITCNRLSEKYGLDSYYRIDEKNITNVFSNDIELYLDNYDNIIKDLTSDGWHLPNEEEISIVLKSSKSPENDGRWMGKEQIQNGTFMIYNEKE